MDSDLVPPDLARWAPGVTVVLQEVWRGRLWSARPVTVAHDDGALVALWCPRGTRWKTATTPPTRRRAATRAARFVASLTLRDWVLGDFTWDVDTLCLVREGDWHAVRVAWRANPDAAARREHWGWYVNLQEPVRRTARGLQTMDLMLDVVVDRNRQWRWKDEDELEALVTRKLLDPTVAQRVREEALRVVDRVECHEPPFGDAWPAWRPDPSWTPPVLPDGWDHL
jgi:hypothetical protein